MVKNKYNIGNKIRTRIHYLNDSRKEVDAIICGIKIEENTVKYEIDFVPNEYDKEMGCTGCNGYVDQDDILGSI